VPQGGSGAVWLIFSNHLSGEGRVVRFGCGGSETSGSIENEFGVLFVPDDVRGGFLPGLGEGKTPYVCIAVFDAVDDDLGAMCSRGGYL
jgi:hypothetical protein